MSENNNENYKLNHLFQQQQALPLPLMPPSVSLQSGGGGGAAVGALFGWLAGGGRTTTQINLQGATFQDGGIVVGSGGNLDDFRMLRTPNPRSSVMLPGGHNKSVRRESFRDHNNQVDAETVQDHYNQVDAETVQAVLIHSNAVQGEILRLRLERRGLPVSMVPLLLLLDHNYADQSEPSQAVLNCNNTVEREVLRDRLVLLVLPLSMIPLLLQEHNNSDQREPAQPEHNNSEQREPAQPRQELIDCLKGLYSQGVTHFNDQELIDCLKGLYSQPPMPTQNHNNADHSEPSQSRTRPPRNYNNAEEKETLQDLSRALGGSWKSLGRYLGIADATLRSFRNDHDTTREAAYQMLLHWAQVNGRNATTEKLAEGLRKAERTDLADYVEL